MNASVKIAQGRVVGIGHVAYAVSDLDRALAFYCDKLGMMHAFDAIIDGVRKGAWVRVAGRNFLELFCGQLAGPAEGQSYRHLCLEVDDVAAYAARLTAAGVEVPQITSGSDGTLHVFIHDGDGNRIELQQYMPGCRQQGALEE